MRILFYLIIGLAIATLIRQMWQGSGRGQKPVKTKSRPRPRDLQEVWVQVYDTDSLEELKALQARLEEEEVDCFIYEQGRKDIYGNLLKGFGIAVPRTSVGHAQKIIARMPT